MCASFHLDGPHADPSMVRPSGPNQMVSRMPNPAGETHRRINDCNDLLVTSALCKGVGPKGNSGCLMTPFPTFAGMNQFGQMGMQSMGQRSTPPLPHNTPVNQVGILVFHFDRM